jgi:beta-galactosidase
VKKTYQYIHFLPKDLEKGIITVKNLYDFTNLSGYSFKWVLMKNGEKITEGKFTTELAPKAEKDIKIDLPDIQFNPGTEYYLNLFAFTTKGDEIIPADFEVAREQFAFKQNQFFEKEQTYGGLAKMSSDKNRLTIEAGKVVITFNKQRGTLENYLLGGKNMLEQAPEINFWRAPTDNDFGNGMQRKSNIWRNAGEARQLKDFQVKETNSGITINVHYLLTDIASDYFINYVIDSEGTLKIEAEYKAGPKDLPEMPRLGMLFTLPSDLDQFCWYGRGPLENYSDRKFSSFIGKYSIKVSEQIMPYVRPQEFGNRTDVRWLTLTNGKGEGIQIKGLQPLSVSALNNRPEDFDPGMTKKQQHPTDVAKRFNITLAVDLAQRGLGGDNSWGQLPHQPYRLLEHTYKYAFILKPL